MLPLRALSLVMRAMVLPVCALRLSVHVAMLLARALRLLVCATLLPLLALLPLAHAVKLSALALCRPLRATMLLGHTLHLLVRAAVLSTCSLLLSVCAVRILLAHHSSCWCGWVDVTALFRPCAHCTIFLAHSGPGEKQTLKLGILFVFMFSPFFQFPDPSHLIRSIAKSTSEAQKRSQIDSPPSTHPLIYSLSVSHFRMTSIADLVVV
jgi:hypothetical protein